MRKVFLVIFVILLFGACTVEKTDEVDDKDTSDQSYESGMSDNQSDTSDESEMSDEESDTSDESGMSDNQSDTSDESEMSDNQSDTSDESEMSDDQSDQSDESEMSDEQSDQSEIPDEDTATSDHVEVINNTDGSVTVNVTLNAEKDAVTSYLMDAASSSWNYFYGSSINVGFRVYDLLEDEYVAYHSAFRFTDVDVPAGATIESAEFSFHPTNEVDSSKKLYLRAAMEKSVDSEPFDTSNYTTDRPDQRSETTASIDEHLLKCIELDDCYDPESSYCKDRAKDCWDREVRYTMRGDFKEMVQEIIDTTGWVKKNAMTVFITGTYPSAMPSGERPDYSNDRSVTGYDTDKAPSYYPVLSITFTVK